MEKGQEILVLDLEDLLAEARAGEFGDFSNNNYPAPKMALVKKLDELRINVTNGKYD